MSVNSFAYALRVRRKELELTQLQLAQKVGCSDKDISSYERGESYPRKALRDELERELGSLPAGRAFQAPRRNTDWCKLFQRRKRWRPRRERSFGSRLKTARIHYPKHMAKLGDVVREHRSWLSAARHGSSLELLLCLLIFALGAIELAVRPVSWGFRRLAVHDDETGECRADYCFPALGLAWEDCHVVIVPQVPVKIGDRVIVIDFLVGLRVGRRRLWFALEVDGAGHVSHEDELRAQHLEVVRFSEAQILAPSFPDDLKRRLLSMAQEVAAVENAA